MYVHLRIDERDSVNLMDMWTTLFHCKDNKYLFDVLIIRGHYYINIMCYY